MSYPAPNTPIFDLLNQLLSSDSDTRRIFVAFSGGMDSTVLLHQARAWKLNRPEAPEIVAWHVNHQIQEACGDWEAHCARVSAEWGLSYRVAQVDVEDGGRGHEAAAREARYAVFEESLGRGEVLLMAHHLDDQVETFFLRLMRGSGLKGLSGMPARRPLGRGYLLRPLLHENRSTLRAYAEEHRLYFVDDPSNDDIGLDRNYLRHQVMPMLAQRWPGYRQTVARASGHVASALHTLEDHLPEPVTVYSTLGDPGLPMQVLASGAHDVAAIRLRAWLHARNLAMPGSAVVDEFLRQLGTEKSDSAPKMDCGSYALQRYADAVYLVPNFDPECEYASYTLRVGESCAVAGIGTMSLTRASTQGFALSLDEAVELVWRSGGERCQPLGRDHSQTLKKLFQERAVPPWWRSRVPLLFCGAEMLAVGDLWLCESSRLKHIDECSEALWQLDWRRNSFPPPN